MKNPHILFIATANPFIRSGGGIANLAYYKAIDALYPGCVDLAISEEEIPNNQNGYNFVPIKARSIYEKIFGVLTGSIHRYKKSICKILRESKYDLCVINGGHYAGDMIEMIHRSGSKVMVMHHNFEREYQTTSHSNMIMRCYYVHKTIQNERISYLKSDINCFITQDDLRLFQQAYGQTNAECHVVGVFEPELGVTRDYYNKCNTLTFVISGSVNAEQTVDGIKDFHDYYWPILNEVFPSCKLIFTGRNADRLLSIFPDFINDQIEIFPNPENIDEIVSMAHLYICPINVGGGLKLRVMDGLKMGLPVLTHSVSARGYEPFIGKPYFKVYNDKESFRNGLRDLVRFVKESSSVESIRQDYYYTFGFQNAIQVFSFLSHII